MWVVSLLLCALLAWAAVFGYRSGFWAAKNAAPAPTKPAPRFPLHLADYDAEPRLPNGRVDVDALVARLRELGATYYYWLIWHAKTDWDDLKLFLPKAAEAKIEVGVYLVPPSESPPYSEPFCTDYPQWAEEIARLSLDHPNLTAWSIDDFYSNYQIFTPAYIRQMQLRAHGINPRLAFLPVMYFINLTPRFVSQYCPLIDGVVVAYPRDRRDIDCAAAVLSGAPALPGQLVCPWYTPSPAGCFAAATVSAKVLPADRHVIGFRERGDYGGPTAGCHFEQLLIDDAVVWENDVARGTCDWRNVTVDVSRQVRGRKTVAVTFRLFDKKMAANFGFRWDLADLQATGLQPTADFREPQKWQASHKGILESGFGEAVHGFASQARFRFIVVIAAHVGSFRSRDGEPAAPEQLADRLRMCLQAYRDDKCDGVITYCLDKGPQSKTFPAAAKVYKEFRPPQK